MGLIFDTNFIVTAEREALRRTLGATNRFLTAHSPESLAITFTVAAELACGQSIATR